MTLGEKIKCYRNEKKLSQEKVAELVGVSRQAVAKWEANQSKPSTENLIKFSEVVNISIDDLITTGIANHKQPSRILNRESFLKLFFACMVLLGLGFIFTKNTLIWQLLNTFFLIGLTVLLFYICKLCIEALNKYLRAK